MKNNCKLAFKSKKFAIKATAVLMAVVFLAAFCLLGIYSPVKEGLFYKIDKGATISSVAIDMREKGLVVSADLFKASALILGGRIQSGEYEISAGASIWRIAKMFNRGDVASTVVLMTEGLTVKQIKNLLMENPALSGSVECAKPDDAEKANAPAANPVCDLKEGELFPDTYYVARGTNRLAVLELARRKMESIRIGWQHSGKSLPSPLKSWNEVMTLASIVQKETPKTAEMPLVASVYLNRLKKRIKLQADPTVVYAITNGLGHMQGKGLFANHLKTNSPYNTYVNYGLPPSPISNVGRNAISAVLNPADTNYLFFVADGQGGHKFAKSYEEHQKNHADWRNIKKLK
jgi:UPF0755 protein